MAALRDRTCKACGGKIIRLDICDAYACRRCDHWFSKPCTPVHGPCDLCDELRKYKKPSDIPPEEWTNSWNT